MSRKIKFRAWDGNRMCALGIMGVLLTPSDDGTWYEQYDFDADREWTHPVMQFTGLTDQRGREIYEGDILLVEKETDSAFGTTHDFNAVVEWDNQNLRYGFKEIRHDDKYAPVFADYSDFDRYTLIGNIYENPELLKAGDA